MTRLTRLSIVVALNLTMVVGLLAVDLTAGSLGVLTAGVGYLADAAAIAIALLAAWLAQRPPTAARPNGYPRATTLAALIDGAWLLVLSVFVAGAAIRRLTSGVHHVDGFPVLIVSGIGRRRDRRGHPGDRPFLLARSTTRCAPCGGRCRPRGCP